MRVVGIDVCKDIFHFLQHLFTGCTRHQNGSNAASTGAIVWNGSTCRLMIMHTVDIALSYKFINTFHVVEHSWDTVGKIHGEETIGTFENSIHRVLQIWIDGRADDIKPTIVFDILI